MTGQLDPLPCMYLPWLRGMKRTLAGGEYFNEVAAVVRDLAARD
jgi:hypothetical protein